MRMGRLVAVVGAGAVMAAALGQAVALEEGKDEKAALKACEKSLCELVTRKQPADGDFSCGLSKTWQKTELKEGSSAGKLSWGFGDARCTVDLKLARAVVISAVKDPKSTLQFPDHAVNCEIEGEKDVTKVKATLAPKAEFVDGKVAKVWVNLKEVEGPAVVKGLAFAAAKLEDNLGVFHSALVKALNHMLHEKCPRIASGG
ncbi:MAG: hypothetical protein SFW09_11505 [Hyphomicrobiaceae bacterium]|nr:hypothetical protein [Hyphomicrobiaceae bacterium]